MSISKKPSWKYFFCNKLSYWIHSKSNSCKIQNIVIQTHVIQITLKIKQLQNLIKCKNIKSNTKETMYQCDGRRFEEFIGNCNSLTFILYNDIKR